MALVCCFRIDCKSPDFVWLCVLLSNGCECAVSFIAVIILLSYDLNFAALRIAVSVLLWLYVCCLVYGCDRAAFS